MGIGCGFAVAASLIEQNKPVVERCPVVAVQGDSAFGFSAMEFETACRYVDFEILRLRCCHPLLASVLDIVFQWCLLS